MAHQDLNVAVSDVPSTTKEHPAGTPEHVQKMVDKANADQGVVQQQQGDTAGAGTTAATTQQQDQLLAGKYKTEEELQKGIIELAKTKYQGNLAEFYKDLERGAVAPQQQAQQAPISTTISTEAEAREAVSSKGLNFDKYAVEYASSGKLSEASMAELEKAGIPNNTVQTYITGLQAAGKEIQATAFEAAGGPDQFLAMRNWGANNFTASEKIAFDKAIHSGNKDTIRMAVTALKARYSEVHGSPPKVRIEGTAPSSLSSSDVYHSQEEFRKDVRDKRYKNDPAFRAMCIKKLERSNIM